MQFKVKCSTRNVMGLLGLEPGNVRATYEGHTKPTEPAVAPILNKQTTHS